MASVTVSLGFKYNLGNYNSASAFYSFTDDIREGETPEEAADRVEAFVEGRCDKKFAELSAQGK